MDVYVRNVRKNIAGQGRVQELGHHSDEGHILAYKDQDEEAIKIYHHLCLTFQHLLFQMQTTDHHHLRLYHRSMRTIFIQVLRDYRGLAAVPILMMRSSVTYQLHPGQLSLPLLDTIKCMEVLGILSM